MENNTIELVTQLTEKVEELGGDLFVIAMKQQPVEIINHSIELCIYLILMYMGYKLCTAFSLEEIKEELDKDDWSIIPIFSVCLGITTIIISGLQMLYSIENLVQWIFNPEYASLQEIAKLIK